MTVDVDNGLALNSAIEAKLATIQEGATANSNDATLRDRSTHTGTQLAATVSDFAPSVRSTALTGLSTATVGTVTAADTVLSAAGKLQAQITAQKPKPRVPAVAGRFYSNCNSVATFSAASVAALQQRTTFFEPLADMRVDQIGVFLTVAPSAVARIKLAVYEFDAANPSQLNLLHDFAEITADTTIGAKMASATFTFLAGRFYVFVHHSDTALTYRNLPASSALPAVLPTIDATIPAAYWFFGGVPYSAIAAPTLDTSAMTPFASNPALILMRAA